MKKISVYIVLVGCFVAFSLYLGKKNSGDEYYASVYKPGVLIINKFKNSKYENYIQKIYVNPLEKNKLVILIKPNYWVMLTDSDKKNILIQAEKEWASLFKTKNPNNALKPAVNFANQ